MTSWKVDVGQFNGPLDLLLQLIEKESWEISKSIERTIAKMQIKPSEVKMEKSITMMEKKPAKA